MLRGLTRLGGGLFALGVRFATAARGRWFAAVATIAVCAGVVTLMLALASLLVRLREDPGTVGKRYQLAVSLDHGRCPAPRRRSAGSTRSASATASTPRTRSGSASRCGSSPTPATTRTSRTRRSPRGGGSAGRTRSRSGSGWPTRSGCGPASVLAAQIPDGGEVRFRVSGIVRALENDGRIAWVEPDRLLALRPDLNPQVVVRVKSGADPAAVTPRAGRTSARRLQPVGAAQTDNAAFLAVLAAVLRGVGLAVGLVCLYALVQALTVTARERRGAVALLRAFGADGPSVGLVLAGAAIAVAIPAAAAGVVLEVVAFGPLVAHLAAGFAALPLAPTLGQIALVAGGLLALVGRSPPRWWRAGSCASPSSRG